MKTLANLTLLLMIFAYLTSCDIAGNNDEDDIPQLSEVTVYLDEDCYPGETIFVYNTGSVTDSDGITTSLFELVGRLNGTEQDVVCAGDKGLTIPFDELQKCETCGLGITAILEDFTHGSFSYSASEDNCTNALNCDDFYWNRAAFLDNAPELIQLDEINLASSFLSITRSSTDLPIIFEMGNQGGLDIILLLDGSESNKEIVNENKTIVDDIFRSSPVVFFSMTIPGGSAVPDGFEASVSINGTNYSFSEDDLGEMNSDNYQKIYYFWRDR